VTLPKAVQNAESRTYKVSVARNAAFSVESLSAKISSMFIILATHGGSGMFGRSSPISDTDNVKLTADDGT